MKRAYYIVGLIMLTFFVISFLTNIIGPIIPDIIREFHLSLALVALLPFAFFIAYGVMSIPAGMLLEKYKEKRVMIAAFALAFSGALLLAATPGYTTAVISLFLIGCGMAMLQVIINPLLRIAGGEEHYAFNSVLAQLIFGLASFLSPLVYSYMVSRLEHPEGKNDTLLNFIHAIVPANLPWISLYWFFALICLVMIAVIGISKFPAVELKDGEQTDPLKTHFVLFKQPLVLLFFSGIFCYVGIEQGVANWISQFLAVYHGFNPQTVGAQEVAYFWGWMTAGGVIGLLLLKVMDSRKVLIIFSLLAIISLSIGLFGNKAASLAAFPLIGFFASVMYPIIFSLALNSIKLHHGAFSGILVTGIIGGAIMPLIIGWLGDHFGLRLGLIFLYLPMGYIFLIGFWATPIVTNKTIRIARRAASLHQK